MKLKTIGLFAVAAILVLGAPMLGAKILNWLAEREWGQVQAEAKAIGLPLTVEEALKDYQPGPDEQNAAEGVKEVLRGILTPPKAGSNEFLGSFKPVYKTADMNSILRGLFESGTKQDWAELRQAVKVLDDPLMRLERELKKPDWHFKRDWQKGTALLLPDAARLKQLSRNLHAKALVAMKDDDFPTAFQSVEALIRLGRHYQTEPAIVLILVGVTIESIGCQAALDLARLHPLSSSQRAALTDLVRPTPGEVDWRRIWLVEGTGALAMMSLFLAEEDLREKIGFREGDGPAPFSYRKYLKAKKEVARILIEAEQDWAHKPESEDAAILVATKHSASLSGTLARYSEVFAMLSGMDGTDPIVEAIEARKRQEATRRLAYLALQISAQPSGKWHLPIEASQEAWLDPFSGKPMILAQDAESFRLYSVGANGLDDGGKVERDANDERLDIVVSFPSR